MNKYLIITIIFLNNAMTAYAGIANPIIDYKNFYTISTSDKILKWESDINGDGRNEVLLCLKSDYNTEKENRQPSGWDFYISNSIGAVSYTKSTGTETKPDQLSVDDIPQIDHERCFIGVIDELGKKGIMTIRYNNPREGPSIAIIYAYTVEGDHLKKTELVRYPDSTTPNAKFTKYLADNKRTVIVPVEVTP
jgi:hypothetical protein